MGGGGGGWWWAEEGGGRAIFPLDTFIKILTIAILSYFVMDKRGSG